jgi:dihydrofolate reductase
VRRLIVFNQVSLDGYFSSMNGDISWLRKADRDAEWDGFVADNANAESVLMFGRITYELMAGYWPTPVAAEHDPVVAQRMNHLPKVVFSRTLEKASWANTRLAKGDLATEIRKLKGLSGPDLVILGSGSIVSQAARHGLIDQYQFVVFPVALGKGRTVFDGLNETLSLKLTAARTFGNGNVLVCYEPVR